MEMKYSFDPEPDFEPGFDPASLLPFECRLEPDDPTVEKLRRAYGGSMEHSMIDSNKRYG